MNATPKTETELIEYFEKSRRFSEVRSANLSGRPVRLIGLFGTLTSWEVENVTIKPIAKKGAVTYYEI